MEKRGERCLTFTNGFYVNCIDEDSLEVSTYSFVKEDQGVDNDHAMHKLIRHVAYRRLVRWIWGILGKNVRKRLPACVYRKIREEFPSDRYVGFQHSVYEIS